MYYFDELLSHKFFIAFSSFSFKKMRFITVEKKQKKAFQALCAFSFRAL